MTNKSTASGLGIGFIVGAVVGLALGVLYAPRRGVETRELISKRMKGAKEKAEELVEKAKEKAAEIKE
jgi:gas vesicle protein